MRFLAFTRDGVAGLAVRTDSGLAGLMAEDAS